MIQSLINIADIRREYIHNKLRRTDLTVEPMDLFERWLKQAYAAQISDATAMSMGTVDKNGQSYQRTVLLKYFDRHSMVFYTNLNSRKAAHLAHNPQVSLHFPWHAMERQVLVLGKAEQLSVTEVLKYFNSRPRNSQISTWVSNQSSLILSRGILEKKFLELEKKFKHDIIPLPDFWGGYLVNIDVIEFWQGGEYRLHDRFRYLKDNKKWQTDRLAP